MTMVSRAAVSVGVMVIVMAMVHGGQVQNAGPIYAAGWNSMNQLGIEDTSQINLMQPIKNIPLSPTTGTAIYVMVIACGRTHTLMVSNDGDVYVSGENTQGQLGLGDYNRKVSFMLVPTFRSSQLFVVHCAANSDFSLCVTDAGLVFGWGANDKGQLGIGDTFLRSTPVQVQTTQTVIKVAAGYRHSLAIANTGQVLSWGSNKYGQLGSGDFIDRLRPDMVVGLTGYTVISIAAGDYHSAALTDSGELFTWGWNRKGQLGSWNTTTLNRPNKVKKKEAGIMFLVSLSVGAYHTITVTDSGEVWVFGSNSDGQLGLGMADFNPHPIPLLLSIEPLLLKVQGAIAVAGSYHSIIVTASNVVWGWGWNKYGQLGNGTSLTAVLQPIQITLPKIAGVSPIISLTNAGFGHTIITTELGDTLQCGYNRYGVYVCAASVERLPTRSTDTQAADAIIVNQQSQTIYPPPRTT